MAMNFDALSHPYASRRMTVFANRGMVATSHPLAAEAGLEAFRKGGNAIDAAIATATALTVVEPTSNGIGSDAFALVWSGGKLHGLNASGSAPQGLSIDALTQAGIKEMPRFGWPSVTVPGTPAAWATLSERFGKLPLTESLAPAIQYAEAGHPLSPITAKYWAAAFRIYKQSLQGSEFQAWFDTFAPTGQAPAAGEMWRSPGHAKTLRSIAETAARSFYEGDIADQIDKASRQQGGYLRKADLAAFQPEWVTPISVNYRGYDVWEIPPNGQGIIALIALNLLKGFDFSERETVRTYHQQIEAIKLAFADGKRYITDARHMDMRIEDLLSDAYATERRKLIGQQAAQPLPGVPDRGGTVYLATADNEGNMVSFIQSNYMGFGSGVVIPGTGIAMQNRGHTFSLDKQHVNALEPGKRTYHTIIPGFLTKKGEPIGPFGVMGGFMQPQGHVQVVMNTVDFGMNPQAALDAPRWQWLEDKKVSLERQVPEHIAQALARAGHQVAITNDGGSFGRGEIIWRLPSGVLAGGTEPRADGTVLGW